eukprot:TRINITY_DN501_c0_g1_i3.p1 TRINITY_DN501_c0_g1~~TRINITY_DN501_c0_g1_i3.p1  ORF type:complete len:310 (-),score=95.25 TRINITY_DN501_c0_g1_i3:299-1117(-)
MATAVTRVLYRSFLRSAEEISARVPPVGVALIQKDLLGAESLGEDMRSYVRKSFREKDAEHLSAAFTTLQGIKLKIRKLPEVKQEMKYEVGTVFKHRVHGYTGIIYEAYTTCPELASVPFEDQLVYGRYQPFYRVLLDDFPKHKHCLPQEWIQQLPFTTINHPEIDDYFEVIDEKYVPKSLARRKADAEAAALAKAEAEEAAEAEAAEGEEGQEVEVKDVEESESETIEAKEESTKEGEVEGEKKKEKGKESDEVLMAASPKEGEKSNSPEV